MPPAGRPSFKHYSSHELSILEHYQKKGKTPTEVATLMGRDTSSVYRHFQRNLTKGKAPNPVGRKRVLTDAQVDRLVTTAQSMTAAADGKYQVTAKMVKEVGPSDGF